MGGMSVLFCSDGADSFTIEGNNTQGKTTKAYHDWLQCFLLQFPRASTTRDEDGILGEESTCLNFTRVWDGSV